MTLASKPSDLKDLEARPFLGGNRSGRAQQISSPKALTPSPSIFQFPSCKRAKDVQVIEVVFSVFALRRIRCFLMRNRYVSVSVLIIASPLSAMVFNSTLKLCN